MQRFLTATAVALIAMTGTVSAQPPAEESSPAVLRVYTDYV